MYLGQANGIDVSDVDLSDTQDVRPSFTDIVLALSEGTPASDRLAVAWLHHRETYE